MISLSDEELGIVMTLAAPLHPDRRSAFLEAVLAEAAKYGTGPGRIHRIAAMLQKSFVAPTPRLAEPAGATRQIERRR
jgi:hypothetical protein